MGKKFCYLLAFCFLSFSGFSQNADIDLLKNINLHRNQDLDGVFTVISDSRMPLSLAVPAGAAVYALVKKDEESRKKALLINASMFSAVVLSTSLKYTVQRDRPFVTYPEIDPVIEEDSPSFPSGHAAMSFSLATSVSLAYPKWYVVTPAYLWAGSVAYSRMHLGVHYPSDVLAGAIIGAGSTYLSYRLNHWLDKQWKRHISTVQKKTPPVSYDVLAGQRFER